MIKLNLFHMPLQYMKLYYHCNRANPEKRYSIYIVLNYNSMVLVSGKFPVGYTRVLCSECASNGDAIISKIIYFIVSFQNYAEFIQHCVPSG